MIINDKDKDIIGIKMSIQDKLKSGFIDYLDKQEEYVSFKDDNTIIENKIDNYLFESDEVKQVKTLLKKVYSKCIISNDIEMIQYYSSLFSVIVSTIVSGKDIGKVRTLINS
jgi:hypothetical protein